MEQQRSPARPGTWPPGPIWLALRTVGLVIVILGTGLMAALSLVVRFISGFSECFGDAPCVAVEAMEQQASHQQGWLLIAVPVGLVLFSALAIRWEWSLVGVVAVAGFATAIAVAAGRPPAERVAILGIELPFIYPVFQAWLPGSWLPIVGAAVQWIGHRGRRRGARVIGSPLPSWRN
jgi:hypothetical protein